MTVTEPIVKELSLALQILVNKSYTVFYSYPTKFTVVYTVRWAWSQRKALFIHSFSILPDDRSKASSKTMPPHSAIKKPPPSNENILSCP